MIDESAAVNPSMDRPSPIVRAIAMAVGSPIVALVVIFVATNIVVRLAPGAVMAVGIASVVLWLGSILITAKGVHHLLWRTRSVDSVPGWAKGFGTLLATLVWMGIFVKVLGWVFPSYFASNSPPTTAGAGRALFLPE
jgi:hypothetical protein